MVLVMGLLDVVGWVLEMMIFNEDSVLSLMYLPLGELMRPSTTAALWMFDGYEFRFVLDKRTAVQRCSIW